MDQIDGEDWQEFRKGRQSGLERIYNRHKNSMYTYCCYLTGDRELSEDIVQQTFVKLIECRRNLQTGAGIKGWLFVCARNLALNHLKKRSGQRRPVLAENITGAQVDMNAEAKLFIDNILGKLTQDERELILLREQQRFSIREISEMMGISDQTARVRLYRVRRKMQQIATRKP